MSKYITRKYHNRKIQEEREKGYAALRARDSYNDKIMRIEKELEKSEAREAKTSNRNRELESRHDNMISELREIKIDMVSFDSEVMLEGQKELVIERQYGRIEGLLRTLIRKYSDVLDGYSNPAGAHPGNRKF